jgi:hypothetical protein
MSLDTGMPASALAPAPNKNMMSLDLLVIWLSQKPRSNVFHRRQGESPFMKVVNQVGDEVAVKDRDGSAFCVEAPPVRAG